MQRIEGRTAFVTGAASGIGLGIAESLLEAGARVVLADRDVTLLGREVTRLGSAAVAQELDVTDRAGWEEALRSTEDHFGPVDILVNNAGIGPDLNDLVDVPAEHFDRVVSVMLSGVFNGVHTFGAGMRDRGEGHIVNVSSLNGILSLPRFGPYTAAKFGVVGLSEVLRIELEPSGVGVSVLCPGAVLTNLLVGSKPHPADHPGIVDPHFVGELVLTGIRENEPYLLTHVKAKDLVAKRCAALLDAFDRESDRRSQN